MKMISEGLAKQNRLQGEYDQLAQDLQTRLDDKALKAGEIIDSFKEFKAEIMGKAENSRTGLSISKRKIEEFDVAEQKKDEDLEKIRLRNISLRQQLRKLERTLKIREQLAEGLHMIDFEQLKIENQVQYSHVQQRFSCITRYYDVFVDSQ